MRKAPMPSSVAALHRVSERERVMPGNLAQIDVARRADS